MKKNLISIVFAMTIAIFSTGCIFHFGSNSGTKDYSFTGTLTEFKEKYESEYSVEKYTGVLIKVTITDTNPDLTVLGDIINNNVKPYLDFDLSACTEITAIPADWITNNHYANIKNLILPDSVETIGENSLHNLSGIERFAIPDKVSVIEAKALPYNITSVTFSDNVTTIKDSAFENYSELTEVNFSDNITSIGKYAFYSCDIKKLTLPANLENLGDYGFYGNSNLESLTINSKLKTIPSDNFDYMTKLKTVVIPEGVETIGATAFRNDTALESINIPASVTSISAAPFYNCTNLKTITVSEGSTYCKVNSTYGYLEVKDSSGYRIIAYEAGKTDSKIVLDDDIYRLGEDAFDGASNIQEITFGKNFKSLLSYCLANCPKLQKLKFTNTTINSDNNYIFGSNPTISEITIAVPSGYLSNYQSFIDSLKNTYNGKITITAVEE